MLIPKTREEADQLLRRMCEIRSKVDLINRRLQDKVKRATDDALAAESGLLSEDAALKRTLKTYFATLTPADLGDRRSLKLNYGTLGKRVKDAVKCVRGWTWEMAVEALKTHGLRDAVRVEESVKKDVVLAADAERRAIFGLCGLRVDSGETFYVDLDEKRLAEMPEEGGAK